MFNSTFFVQPSTDSRKNAMILISNKKKDFYHAYNL
jgi:hypothetical protein